jgi:hypothetical protein
MNRKRRLMQLCAVTSCGVLSSSCAAKWEGAPTTAVRHVGRNPTRPSCRMRPFRRCGLGAEPCSDNIGQSVVDDDLDLAVQISSARTAAAAFCVAVKRIVRPASRALQRMDCISASPSAKRGPMLRNSRSPASVGNTRRVVRVRSRTPRRSLGHASSHRTPIATRQAASLYGRGRSRARVA